jgi:hypothetical protein
MALFFLSYDLRNKRDYQPLYDELEKFNAVRVLESCWCFKSIKANAISLRDHFKNFVDGDDGLLISQVAEADGTYQWASCNLDGSPNKL